VIEATAALQDLALRSSPPEQRGTRLATLRELLADRPQEIRCAHNGPYLVTNAERIRDWLGQEIRALPQIPCAFLLAVRSGRRRDMTG
jgi:hypothetical protein